MCSIAVASQVHEDDVYTLICQLRGNYNLPRDDFACVYTHYLKKPCIQSYVALQAGRAVGFISVFIRPLLHHGCNMAEVVELVVDESMRGHGVGKQLFCTAVQAAKAAGCPELELVSNKKRLSAHKFYESQGMKNTHFGFNMPL